MAKIEVQAFSTTLTQDEIRDVVGSSKMRELAGHGVLHAYVLAHEGLSKPKTLGKGVSPLVWPRKVVEAVQNVVRLGTKWFKGHGKDTNSHAEREPLGEVVGTLTKEINGKATAIVIGHFPNAEAVKNLDVVSMEANVSVEKETIMDVEDISAIAMGSSETDSPAFAGAVRLASLQCFDNPPAESKESLEKGRKGMTQEELNAAPFEMIKQAILSRKVWPSQLYTVEDVKGDRVFHKDFDELDTLRTKHKTLETEHEELKKTTAENARKAQEATVKDTLSALLKEGVTEKQRTFLLSRFAPEKVKDLSETGLKAWIEDGKKEFAETAKLFGVSTEQTTQTKTETKSTEQKVETASDDPIEQALASLKE